MLNYFCLQDCHSPAVSNQEASDPRLIWNCQHCSRSDKAGVDSKPDSKPESKSDKERTGGKRSSGSSRHGKSGGSKQDRPPSLTSAVKPKVELGNIDIETEGQQYGWSSFRLVLILLSVP